MITINKGRVQDLANSFLSFSTADDFNTQITPDVKASREVALKAFFWASTILHATKGGFRGYFEGKFFKGWDYLLRAFCKVAECRESLVSIEYMLDITGSELVKLLENYAEDAEVNLPDADRRAEILNECAFELQSIFSGSVSRLLEDSSHKVSGSKGAYAQLAKLSAFKDPLKKKSSAFLMTVHFSGLWEIEDQVNVLPMIDYHRMRLLCRTGCIEVNDQNVLERLIEQKPVSKEVEQSIRRAASEVCKAVVELTQIPMFDFDVLIWAHARSCCRDHPVCISGKVQNDSFYSYLDKNFAGRCEFQEWCPGFRDVSVRSLWEPIIKTENY